MKGKKYELWKDILLAILISCLGYICLLSTSRTGLVDKSIEAVLFLSGSIVALRGYFRSKKVSNKNFKKFELFYGITYLVAGISFIMVIAYLIKNPNVKEIGIADIEGNTWLIIMSTIKSTSILFLVFTWVNFYKYLKIKKSLARNIIVFLGGVSIYFGASTVIWNLTGDINVLSLGLIIGIVIGIFALIAQDKRTRYLTIIFIIYSTIHLIEFYIMGTGKNLTTGVINPIYWGITVLYVLEIKRWIEMETNKV